MKTTNTTTAITMRAFLAVSESHALSLFKTVPSLRRHSFFTTKLCSFSFNYRVRPLLSCASKPDPTTTSDGDEEDDQHSVVDYSSPNLLVEDVVDDDDDVVQEPESESLAEDGVYIEVQKLENNSRRIQSRISIDATLDAIWTLLTDYERLADFIPGLALSQLLQKGDNFARLLQIGQQNLAFGLKFNAKGIVDCYEKDLESLPSGMKREIEFKMIEGDFQLFEGKWSIMQQSNSRGCEGSQVRQVNTTLSYIVDVKPKLWLPVGLIEGILCNEIKNNLASIRDEAQKATDGAVHTRQFE